MTNKKAAYAAIMSGLSDEDASALLETTPASIRAYRAHVTMGNQSVDGTAIKSVKLTNTDKKKILSGIAVQTQVSL